MKNTIIKEVGLFPTLSEHYRDDFPSGKIVLKKGEHKKANNGFGAAHILAEHTAELSKHGFSHDEAGVADYIELILRSRAKIFSEFSEPSGNYRPMIVSSRIGTVVLQRQKTINGQTVYSVITAFARLHPRGIQIGTMPRQ